MKKNIIIVLISILFLMFVSNLSSQNYSTDSLDNEIRFISLYLNGMITNESKIAFLNIESEYAHLSEYIIDEMVSNAITLGRYTVVDRHTLDALRAEQQFQVSAEVDDGSAIELGKFLGANIVITGAISEFGKDWRLRIKAIDVQTAQVTGQQNRTIKNSKVIPNLLSGGKTQVVKYESKRMEERRADVMAEPVVSVVLYVEDEKQPNVPTPVVSGPKPGVYTFWPRLQATRAGLKDERAFIPQITVTNDYIVFHFCGKATGAWEDARMPGFYYKENFNLQEIDNPAKFYSPVAIQETSNGSGSMWSLSFNYFKATKVKLTGFRSHGGEQPFVFEEIDFSKASFEVK